MRKIIISLVILLSLIFSSTFAYNITEQDRKIINKMNYKLDLIYKKAPTKIETIGKKTDRILTGKLKGKENTRIYALFNEFKKHIDGLLKKEEEKNIDLENLLEINNKNESRKIQKSFNKKEFNKNQFKVLKIIDGDTIIIDYFGKRENIRFIGIDAPENSKIRKGFVECYGKESKDYLYNLLNNKSVNLEFDETQGKKDKYDRLLAYVILDGKNVNNLIIKNGFAFEYTYNKSYKYLELFKKSQEEAKNKKIGIWNLKTCKLDYSKVSKKKYVPNKDKNGKICDIKGNISYKSKKKIYHLKKCPGYKRTKINLDKGEKWFCSEKEAIKFGWVKSKNCK